MILKDFNCSFCFPFQWRIFWIHQWIYIWMWEFKSLKTQNSSEKKYKILFHVNSVKSFFRNLFWIPKKKWFGKLVWYIVQLYKQIFQSNTLFICFFSYVVKRFQFIQLFWYVHCQYVCIFGIAFLWPVH